LLDFILCGVSKHLKRQLRKSIELTNINIEIEAQINDNVDKEIHFLSIKIYLSNNSLNSK
jgi:hypothetical protein